MKCLQLIESNEVAWFAVVNKNEVERRNDVSIGVSQACPLAKEARDFLWGISRGFKWGSDEVGSALTIRVSNFEDRVVFNPVAVVDIVFVLYLWPPVREVCTNYEVVVFQPRTLNPPHLGYLCLTLQFNIALPPHLFLLLFLDHSFSLVTTASPSVAVHCRIPLVPPAPNLLY